MPSRESGIHVLRPLAGGDQDLVHIHEGLVRQLAGNAPDERVSPSNFALPALDDLSDAESAYLLHQSTQLSLRDGAAPIRSLGKISIAPRPYQLVPLLMALKLKPIRLFIADDVGVGKTIEAALIAKELLELGEIDRLSVLCPPYLCEQWRQELWQKFNIEAVVINSSTIGQLERNAGNAPVYQRFPIHVASIDFVKTEKNKPLYLASPLSLVIVDEAHGAAQANSARTGQQLRHHLLVELAQQPNLNLLFLSATPHSGIPEAFQSLLGLLSPEFKSIDLANCDEQLYNRLAKRLVLRTRNDVAKEWESQSLFPERVRQDQPYVLSLEYTRLFDAVLAFCSEIVKKSEGMEKQKLRVRYWGLLALMRSVMSSPMAAAEALKNRALATEPDQDDPLDTMTFLEQDEAATDETPRANLQLPDSDFNRLAQVAKRATELAHTPNDAKLAACQNLIINLLNQGENPIVWCHFVNTAEYVAKALDNIRSKLPNDPQILCITGRISDEERKARIADIDPEKPRILVATDCLSEGINLQDKFNAVIHYDLPWNPNRTEQREGRVDRYGQKSKKVCAYTLYAPDNPMDGVIIDVLYKKAREIYKALGTHVPVPQEGENVVEALVASLLLRSPTKEPTQLQMQFDDKTEIENLHAEWDKQANRERITRSRFAQTAIKPQQVDEELKAVDQTLGNQQEVEKFVRACCQRFNLDFQPTKLHGAFRIRLDQQALADLPQPVRNAIPSVKSQSWTVSFESPTPAGATYLGRNHPFVAALARTLFEQAIERAPNRIASRAGAIRTSKVDRLTNLLLLRTRYLVDRPSLPPLLAEEALVKAYRKEPNGHVQWLNDHEALNLLKSAQPEANIPLSEKRELVQTALDQWPNLLQDLETQLKSNADAIKASHTRMRESLGESTPTVNVNPQNPPDLVGLLVLQPHIKP